MALIQEKVFKGVIRQKMISKWGVEMSHTAFIVSLFASYTIYIASGANWLYALSVIPIAGLCILVERKEPRAFRLLYLWFFTTLRSGWRALFYYRGSTRAPLSCAKGKRRHRIIH
jgi:type IV secretory pathway VirB3-like protein